MSELVRLTEEQIRFAAYAGVERMIHVIVAGRPETHGGSNGWDEWQRHVEGAMAEMAVAVHLGITWSINPIVQTSRSGPPGTTAAA